MVRVTEILRSAGLINFDMVRPDVMERAQVFGTAVHKATELDDLGVLNMNTVHASIVPYLEAWRAFCKDFNLTFTQDEIEQRLVSEKKNFTGMPDRIKKERKLLLDIKSGSVIAPSIYAQLGGYQILAEENNIRIKESLCVQLTAEGYKIYPVNDSSNKAVFLSALNIYNFKKRHKMLDNSAIYDML
jgi:hypothetical protein